jgi:hypothetical protein
MKRESKQLHAVALWTVADQTRQHASADSHPPWVSRGLLLPLLPGLRQMQAPWLLLLLLPWLRLP